MERIKQLFCRHWFDVQEPYEYEYSEGAIVCGEQKTFVQKVQARSCSKCGLTERRKLFDAYCTGWS